MSNILLIAVCLFSGIFLQKVRGFYSHTPQGINSFIVYISLPALTLYYVPKISVSWVMVYPLFMALILLIGGLILFHLLQLFFKWDKKTLGALVLVGSMGNITFVGFPVVEAAYGEKGLEIAVVISQSAFLVASVLGVLLASYYSNSAGTSRVKDALNSVVRFPPFLAFVAIGVGTLLGFSLPESLDTVMRKLGNTLTPLAMVSIGLQVQLKMQQVNFKAVIPGLSYKLLLAPLLIWAIYSWLLPNETLIVRVVVIEAAMPPMVTAAIIATEYDLNPPLANFLVGFGLLASFFTIALWYYLLV